MLPNTSKKNIAFCVPRLSVWLFVGLFLLCFFFGLSVSPIDTVCNDRHSLQREFDRWRKKRWGCALVFVSSVKQTKFWRVMNLPQTYGFCGVLFLQRTVSEEMMLLNSTFSIFYEKPKEWDKDLFGMVGSKKITDIYVNYISGRA